MSLLTSFLQTSCSSWGLGSGWMLGAPSLIGWQKTGCGYLCPPHTTGDNHLAGGWHCVPLREGSHQCWDLCGDTSAHLGKHLGHGCPHTLQLYHLHQGMKPVAQAPSLRRLKPFGLLSLVLHNRRASFCQRSHGDLLSPGRSACGGGECYASVCSRSVCSWRECRAGGGMTCRKVMVPVQCPCSHVGYHKSRGSAERVIFAFPSKKMQLWILIRCAMHGAPGLRPKGNVAVTFNKY